MTTQSDEFELPDLSQNDQKPPQKAQGKKKASLTRRNHKTAPQTPPQPEPDTNQPEPEPRPVEAPEPEATTSQTAESPAAGIGWEISTGSDAPASVNFDGYNFSQYGIEGEGVNVTYGAQTAVEVNPVTFMSPEQFYTNFEGLFGIGGAVTGLRSLPIKAQEKDGARATSDILYEQCCKVSWLRWLVDKDSADASKYIAVAMFGFGKFAAVKSELAERRRAANDNRDEGARDVA